MVLGRYLIAGWTLRVSDDSSHVVFVTWQEGTQL